MSNSKQDIENVERAIQQCYSTWGDSYYQDYYQSPSAYPPVHTEIVFRELKRNGINYLLDAGCGPASMLRDLAGLGCERFGFDLTDEMVAEARRVLAEQEVPADHIWNGSVLDPTAFKVPAAGYGAIICIGVLPHIPETQDQQVLSNLTNATAPNGLVLVEARNQLFALFTLNRYSRALFRDVLIDEQHLKANTDPDERPALEEALTDLDQQFRMDVPPIRGGKSDEPGYDEVLSRTHNPFELKAKAEQAGLVDIEVLFYHYHCLPPMMESRLPRTFRSRSLALEDPRDWRGHFMASAFIIKGRKPCR